MEAKIGALVAAISGAMPHIDPEPARDGLSKTPLRWARMVADLTGGHKFEITTFPNEGIDEMVVQSNINFYSLCEHHLVPFFGTATIGYLPGQRIVGISKLSRTVEHFARRLQVQERMTRQIAEFLLDNLNPLGVGVVLRARHLCQEMRGVRKPGATTTTSAMLGALRDRPEARAEFMSLAMAADK